MEVEKIMQDLEQKHPGESEYLQAVREVLLSIVDVYNQHPEFEKAKLIERLVESGQQIGSLPVDLTDRQDDPRLGLAEWRVEILQCIGTRRMHLQRQSFRGIEQFRQNARDLSETPDMFPPKNFGGMLPQKLREGVLFPINLNPTDPVAGRVISTSIPLDT